MRLAVRLFAGAAAIAAAAGIAKAGIPVSQTKTCPIGGEQFSFATTASYSTWGGRPDGRPYGSWHFPLALPECPGNRLILYKDFSADELTRLGALIARPDYRALADEAQYYRLHWLMREMGEPADNHLWALVQAGWQVEQGAPQRTRYLEEFVRQMAARSGEPETSVQFAMRGRWINALRELGRFDEAQTLLARTSLAPLDQRDADARENRNRDSWRAYFAMQGRLVGRRDASVEPLDSISSREAHALCIDRAERLTEWDRAFCERESEAVRQVRELRSTRNR
jgi:hypothetical protein